jgi:hypothetical protein
MCFAPRKENDIMVINRDGQNMQINMTKYAHKNAEKMAKYATKYAL